MFPWRELRQGVGRNGQAEGVLGVVRHARAISGPPMPVDLEHGAVLPIAQVVDLRNQPGLLRHLAQRPGRVFSRRELLELVRDYDALDQDEKTINVHISHLREKLEDDPAEPAFIVTVRGAGYAFAER